MLVFATSDKGGTGRSVTSSNVMYRHALQGADVCYLDFDFGSPTAGAVFELGDTMRGTSKGGLHSYLLGKIGDPERMNVWVNSDREILRIQPPGAGKLVVFPGDLGGGEFASDPDVLRRCVTLLQRLEEEFDVCLVDLSAGRSYAAELVLAATVDPALRKRKMRWLVYHRWTEQHILAAADLVFGEKGLLDVGTRHGHDRRTLARSVRFIRSAVVNPDADDLAGLRAAQVTWLRNANDGLLRLAGRYGVGRTMALGEVPLDPVLQWREQILCDDDVVLSQIANKRTVLAFERLAAQLVNDEAWVGL